MNECDDNPGCDHSCNNTEGSYTCGCDEGYELDADGYSCNGIVSLSSCTI